MGLGELAGREDVQDKPSLLGNIKDIRSTQPAHIYMYMYMYIIYTHRFMYNKCHILHIHVHVHKRDTCTMYMYMIVHCIFNTILHYEFKCVHLPVFLLR